MFLTMDHVFKALEIKSKSAAINRLSDWLDWSIPVHPNPALKAPAAVNVTEKSNKPELQVNLRRLEQTLDHGLRLQFVIRTAVDDAPAYTPYFNSWMLSAMMTERDRVGVAVLVTYALASVAYVQQKTNYVINSVQNPWTPVLDYLDYWVTVDPKGHRINKLSSTLPDLYDILFRGDIFNNISADALQEYQNKFSQIKEYAMHGTVQLKDLLWTSTLNGAAQNVEGYGVNLASLRPFMPLTVTLNNVYRHPSGKNFILLVIKYILMHELIHYTNSIQQFGQIKEWCDNPPSQWRWTLMMPTFEKQYNEFIQQSKQKDPPPFDSSNMMARFVNPLFNLLYDFHGNSILNNTPDKFSFLFPTGIYDFNISTALQNYLGAPTVVTAYTKPDTKNAALSYWALPQVIPMYIIATTGTTNPTIEQLRQTVKDLEETHDLLEADGVESTLLNQANDPQFRDNFRRMFQHDWNIPLSMQNDYAQLLGASWICPGTESQIKQSFGTVKTTKYSNIYELYLWYLKTIAVKIQWEQMDITLPASNNIKISAMQGNDLYTLLDTGYITKWYEKYLDLAKNAELVDSKGQPMMDSLPKFQPKTLWDILDPTSDNSQQGGIVPPPPRYEIPPLDVPMDPPASPQTQQSPQDSPPQSMPPAASEQQEQTSPKPEKQTETSTEEAQAGQNDGSKEKGSASASIDGNNAGDKQEDAAPQTSQVGANKADPKTAKDLADMAAKLAEEVGDSEAAAQFKKEAEAALKKAEKAGQNIPHGGGISSKEEQKKRDAAAKSKLKAAGFIGQTELPPVSPEYISLHQKVIASHKTKSKIHRRSYARPNRRRHAKKFLIPGHITTEANRHKWILAFDVSGSVDNIDIQHYLSISKYLMEKSPDADNTDWYVVLGNVVIEQAKKITTFSQLKEMMPEDGDGGTEIVNYVAPFIKDSKGYTGLILFTDGGDYIVQPSLWIQAATHLLLEVVIIQPDQAQSDLIGLDALHQNIHVIEVNINRDEY